MMKLLEKIGDDFKKAFLEEKKETTSVLRLLLAALKNREIELRPSKKELDDEEVIKVIRKEIKKRKEAMAIYKGRRDDLFDQEKREIEILERYLPMEISDEEIIKMIKEKIALLGAINIGRIIGEVMKELGGRADGAKVAALVKKILEK